MSELGRLIVIEGTDGSGTTTQCQLLVQWLTESGTPAAGTCEPSSGPIGSLIRSVLERRLMRSPMQAAEMDWTTLALLFAADRMDHVMSQITPALADGCWMVSDRYDLSSLIYQSVTAPDADAALSWVRSLNLQARRPDLVIVLDVDPSVALRRRQLRGGVEELFERQELQAKLAAAYRVAEQFAPDDPLVHVDGSGEVKDVSRRVRDVVERWFGLARQAG
ncbi:MAG TPA: dTMP kinase [Polyangiaceae bacterium]